MRRRSFLRSTAAAAVVPTLPSTSSDNGEQEQEETLYRVQLHVANSRDEVVVVEEPSEHEALRIATEWAGHSRTLELDGDGVVASIHSTMDESTFGVLRGFGHLYASSRRVYRYVDSGDAHVLG